MQDRNFDDIAEKFARNIYGTTKGKIRRAVVWQDLTGLLAQLPQRPLRILDAGGGEGHMACQLAELGHQVLLCDLSGEMIQRAAQLAEQKGVSQNMQFVQSSAQDIAQHLEQPVDLILFHAVLEWIAEPEAALQALYDCLTPGGALSLMFFNANGLLMRNVVLGNFQLVDRGQAAPQFAVAAISARSAIGLRLAGTAGHAHRRQNRRAGVPRLSAEQTAANTKFEELLALEQHYCRQEPYVSLGRYIHVMAHKPNLKDEL